MADLNLAAPIDQFGRIFGLLMISFPRMLAAITFIPTFGKQHMTMLHRNCIAIAMSLPVAYFYWMADIRVDMTTGGLASRLFIEIIIGAFTGLIIAVPFWILRSAMTIVDTQRGANAAQQANPSIQADTSIMGEMMDRIFVTYLMHIGIVMLIMKVVYNSYNYNIDQLDMQTSSVAFLQEEFFRIVTYLFSTVVRYAAPFVLVMLLIEIGMATISVFVQGIQVYPLAMPLKSLLTLFLLSLMAPKLIDSMTNETLNYIADMPYLGWVADPQVVPITPKPASTAPLSP